MVGRPGSRHGGGSKKLTGHIRNTEQTGSEAGPQTQRPPPLKAALPDTAPPTGGQVLKV